MKCSGRTFKLSVSFLFLFLGMWVISCAKENGEFLTPSSELSATTTTEYLIIVGSDTNHRGIAQYDLDKNLIQLVKNYRSPTQIGQPRGISQIDNDTLLVSIEANDRLETLTLDGESETFFSGPTLNGNIYDSVIDADGFVYQIESNIIEKYNPDGTQTSSPFINTTVGACTLNQPRQMIINPSGELVVASPNNNRILTYDISTGTASCLTSSTQGVNTPHALLHHSNGDLYFATFNNDQIYRANADGSGAVVVFATNTAVLNDPTTMVELPNGDILVSSSANDTIERFTETGTWVETFINDTESLNIADMEIISVTE